MPLYLLSPSFTDSIDSHGLGFQAKVCKSATDFYL